MKQTVAMIICFIMGILAYIFYSLENCYDKERRISDMAIAKDNNESVIKRVDFLKTINMNDANLHFGESDKRFRVTSIPGELCSEYRFQDGCHVFNIILANRGFLKGCTNLHISYYLRANFIWTKWTLSPEKCIILFQTHLPENLVISIRNNMNIKGIAFTKIRLFNIICMANHLK